MKNLKDAYLSVTMWEQHRKYLRFVWNDQLYKFQCLPFGLCSAPRVFTKLLKPVLARLHHQGVRLVIYLDDMLVMSQTRVLGFCDQPRKIPAEIIPNNSIPGLSDRLQRDEDNVDRGEGGTDDNIMQECSAETIPLSTGTSQADREDDGHSTGHLSGPTVVPGIATFEESSLVMVSVLRPPGVLNQEAHLELEWWCTRMGLANGKSILAQEPDLIVGTDASMQGWGAVCKGVL